MTLAGKTLQIGILGLGAVMTILGALIARHWDTQIEQKYYQEMVISPTSQGVDEWISTTVPIISKIYFWNWTNPSEIENIKSKPNFVEMGPYVFREKHRKVNITWNENGTVTYKTIKQWFFDKDLSNGSLNDNITSINTFSTTVARRVKDSNFITRRLLAMLLIETRQKLFWTKTVRELTFDGVDIPLLKAGNWITASIPKKFGYFYGMNDTLPKNPVTMDTGKNKIFNLGIVQSVNHNNVSSAYYGSCSEIKGSLGEFWPPQLTNRSVLQLFAADMCRQISFYYNGESTFKGIPTYVFESTLATIDNGTIIEANQCYNNPDEVSTPSGLFDLSSCQEGAPVFMSFPHLYLADDFWKQQITGMKPNASLHKYFIEAEPKTGIQFNVAARLQMNVRLTPNKGLSMFTHVPEVLIPVFWIETLAVLQDSQMSGVRLLLTLIKIGPYISGTIILIGLSLILFGIIKQYGDCCKRKVKQEKIALELLDAEKPIIVKCELGS